MHLTPRVPESKHKVPNLHAEGQMNMSPQRRKHNANSFRLWSDLMTDTFKESRQSFSRTQLEILHAPLDQIEFHVENNNNMGISYVLDIRVCIWLQH
jgi:hypothetical protein